MFGLDFGLIAIIIIAASKVLDYVAPKTKTKVDDTVRDVVHKVIPLLPAAKEAAAAKDVQARMKADAPAPSMPAPEVKSAAGFKVRDHR